MIPIESIVNAISAVAKSKAVRKTILGEYSDGTPRSIADCIDGEILSPKQREKYIMHQSQTKDKKKGDKKKKHKKAKIKL